MRIFEAEQIRKADEVTILNQGISSLDLMERASKKCLEYLREFLTGAVVPCIFCGNGNNGGDGLAIARLLAAEGILSNVFILEISPRASKDFDSNLEKLKLVKGVKIIFIKDSEDFPDLENSLIIDALLGTGTSRPAGGLLKELILFLNQSGEKIISIDLPSGMPADGIRDNAVWENAVMVHAAITLSFQFPKLAFLLPETGPFAGEWKVLNIGLDIDYIEQTESPYALIDSDHLKGSIVPRARFSNKGTYGHLLLIAGSEGKSGAALLASKAAMRTGVGKLTLCSDRSTVFSLQGYLPDAMSFAAGEKEVEELPGFNAFSCVAIGPGLGKKQGAAKVLKFLLQDWKGPLLIDADGINLLAENPTWINWLPPATVLTPHPLELKRLLAMESACFFDLLKAAAELAGKHHLFINLKSAYSCLITPSGRFLFNNSGTPALAKAGTGDVLSGIIAALLAMGYGSTESVCIGNYLHGRAARLLVQKSSNHSLLAGEIEGFIGQALAEIEN